MRTTNLYRSGKVFVRRMNDSRLSYDLVFATHLNNAPARLLWHRTEAELSELFSQWFATAFHLRQLIASNGADADRLRERRISCDDMLRDP